MIEEEKSRDTIEIKKLKIEDNTGKIYFDKDWTNDELNTLIRAYTRYKDNPIDWTFISRKVNTRSEL